MNLDRFTKLREKFEELSFESNFSTINKVLYYFSYLGNIFLILFSYFFLKTVTDSIPQLFPRQDLFFGIFIVLFMIGYELFKRFSIEQLFQSWFLVRKTSASLIAGGLVCATLVAGSFYLSVKGAHRLVDNTQQVVQTNDSLQLTQLDQLAERYKRDLNRVDQQIDANSKRVSQLVDAATLQGRSLHRSEQINVDRWEQTIVSLKQDRLRLDSTYKAEKILISTHQSMSAIDLETGKENTLAFKLLVLFLEALIIVGVGFNGYFNVSSFGEMKSLMRTEKYRKLTLNLNLLKIYYHNGTKREGDPCPSNSRFGSLVRLQATDAKTADINNFLNLLVELQITQSKNKKQKLFQCNYQKAIELISDHK